MLQSDKGIPGTHKIFKNCEILVDESGLLGYNVSIVHKQKAVKGRVGVRSPFREPRLVEWGTAEMSEHGPGAAQATGSLRRVRPLLRRSMLVLPEAFFVRKARNKVVTRKFDPSLCRFAAQGRFLLLR